MNAGAFKRLHQLFEAFALDFAEKISVFDLEPVKGDFVFLHAAIAKHLDLAAAHAICRERILIRAPWLFGDEHGQTLVSGLVRIGARQQRHDIRTHRMGDPGFVAGDLPCVTVPDRTGAQGSEI